MTPITATLAEWISGIRRDDIPDDIRATLHLLAMDTFACALVGKSQPWTQAIRSWALASESQGQPASHIWGEPASCLRASDAALVNGAAAHAFELDDFHNAKVHLGAVIVPAVFALAERLDSKPDRVEAAIAVGYEVIIRSSLALKPAQTRLRGWHLTAVCGPLGAAAAAAILLGLNPERTSWALGLAGTQSGGLFAFTADGTDSKRFHPGRAAQSGVMAAELAALGLSGPTQIFEAPDGGFLHAFSDSPEADLLIDGLGDKWHAPDTNFKPYACCGSVHPHVDAALKLRERWTSGARVRVGMPNIVIVQCGYDYQPGSSLNAQMSGRYSVAVALLDGAVLPEQFEAARMQREDVVALAAQLELVHDAQLDRLYPAHFCGWVEVENEEGNWIRETILDPSGSIANLSRASAIVSKTEKLLVPLLGDTATINLCKAFKSLGETDLSDLLKHACVAGHSGGH